MGMVKVVPSWLKDLLGKRETTLMVQNERLKDHIIYAYARNYEKYLDVR